MKKKIYFTLLVFILFFTVLKAQQDNIKNLQIEVDDEKVTLTFDIVATGSTRIFDICLRTSNPNIIPKSTTGAIGKSQSTGINQKIDWYYVNDSYTAEQLNNLDIEVIAVDPTNKNTPMPKPKTVPIYAGLGTAALTGGGLMLAGFTKHNDALDNHEIYKNNRDPNDPIYGQLGVTRDELYNDANSSNKTAQLMIYGGATVIAATGVILVNRLAWIRRIEKNRKEKQENEKIQCSINYKPYIELKTTDFGGMGIGIGLTYHF